MDSYIPLACGACLYCRGAWRNSRDRPIVWILAGILGMTVLGAATLATGYDAYSVGGQLPFHLSWYLLPFSATGLWQFMKRFAPRTPLNGEGWGTMGLILLGSAAFIHLIRGPGFSQTAVRELAFRLSSDEVDALNFIQTALPVDAVLLPTKLQPNVALWSGLGGRRSYLDYLPAGNILDSLINPSESTGARVKVLRSIVETSDGTELGRILRKVPASHLVEHEVSPLRVHPTDALRLVWKSRNNQVAIWEIVR